jgi:hypothetical protein
MLKINEFVSEDPKVHRIYGTMHSPTANATRITFLRSSCTAPHLYCTDHTLSRVPMSKLSQSTNQSFNYVDSNIRTAKGLFNASYHSLQA